MKPQKTLDEILIGVQKNVRQAYALLQTQDASGLSKILSELGMMNFSLSWYAAEYEFQAKSLEAEYKRQCSVTFMEQRKGGATEKNADSEAKIKWADMQKQYLDANRAYRLAKSTHNDIENLIDIMRSRLSILKMEMSNLKEG